MPRCAVQLHMLVSAERHMKPISNTCQLRSSLYVPCTCQALGSTAHFLLIWVLLQYLVKRKGLDFTDCGMVDARVAKRQRLQQPGQDEASQSPVSIALVDEWEKFQKSFRCAVHAHNDGGELDLGVHLLW